MFSNPSSYFKKNTPAKKDTMFAKKPAPPATKPDASSEDDAPTPALEQEKPSVTTAEVSMAQGTPSRVLMAKSRKKKGKSFSRSARAGLKFPVGRVSRFLRKKTGPKRLSGCAGVYLAGVLEYLTAELLETAGNEAKKSKKKRIVNRHIMLAVSNDEEMQKFLGSVTISNAGVAPRIHQVLLPKKKKKKKDKTSPENTIESAMDKDKKKPEAEEGEKKTLAKEEKKKKKKKTTTKGEKKKKKVEKKSDEPEKEEEKEDTVMDADNEEDEEEDLYEKDDEDASTAEMNDIDAEPVADTAEAMMA